MRKEIENPTKRLNEIIQLDWITFVWRVPDHKGNAIIVYRNLETKARRPLDLTGSYLVLESDIIRQLITLEKLPEHDKISSSNISKLKSYLRQKLPTKPLF